MNIPSDAFDYAASHRCVDHRERVVLAEGDDVFVERCTVCGLIRYESDGKRPMAWFLTFGPTAQAIMNHREAWPWKYAYDDPRNDPDAPEVWRASQGESDD